MRKCTLVHDECSQSLDSVRCCCAASLRLMRKESRSVERLDYEWSGRRESIPRHKLGKLLPYSTFHDLNLPSDLAVLKTNTAILTNVLDEILEKRIDFQSINNSTLKHESRQNGDFRHDFLWSGRRDSNPRIQAWEAWALPLGDTRMMTDYSATIHNTQTENVSRETSMRAGPDMIQHGPRTGVRGPWRVQGFG